MSDVLKLARPDILSLQPYQHAQWDPTLERMHANEMPWRAQGDNTRLGLNRYPEPQPRELILRLAQLYAQPPERILTGRGSDEAIDLLVRAFCIAGRDAVLICPPTFGYYRVAAQIQGAQVREAPLRAGDFALDFERTLAEARHCKLVFLCSPNNPSGNLLDRTQMLQLCTELAEHALVVVDEAYLEFAGVPSLAARLDDYPNLVVLRTLSKAYALAGARCGALIAATEIVELLKRIIPPYAMPSAAVEEVLRLTEAPQQAMAAARIASLLLERERVRERLSATSAVRRVYASDANFLLVDCHDAAGLLEAGKSVGLLLRDFSRAPGLANCLRISIGTHEQNERVLRAVESL